MRNPQIPWIPPLALLVLTAAPALGQEAGLAQWDAERAEHLFNRAGFGASPEEIAEAVRRGPEAVLDELFAGEGWVEEPFYSRLRGGSEVRERLMRMPAEERKEAQRRMRVEDKAQLRDFLGWWVGRMLAGTDDLRERMVLFWHGHFTSSMQDVKNSHEMILQNQLLRRYALGNFRDLLHAIARDPAMLEYLDNDENRRGKPNENFARELMELFTLGEGNYTERDVKEVARAFTGWSDRDGSFRFIARAHDRGRKTVLGVTGNLDGDDVLDILLEQEACPRHLARRLLTYFEGVEPDPERLADYARFLKESDYEIAPFLRRLFLDPAFYRDEVRGARVASPLDYLVGAARRLRLRPPARWVAASAAAMGERLLDPPNVKGWEGGETWITPAALIQRANLAGVLLGLFRARDVVSEGPPSLPREADPDSAAGAVREAAAPQPRRPLGDAQRELQQLDKLGWRPRYSLARRLTHQGLESDTEIVRALCDAALAVPPEPALLAELASLLEAERAEEGLDGPLLARPDRAEPLLRRLTHAILSLPEASLH